MIKTNVHSRRSISEVRTKNFRFFLLAYSLNITRQRSYEIRNESNRERKTQITTNRVVILLPFFSSFISSSAGCIKKPKYMLNTVSIMRSHVLKFKMKTCIHVINLDPIYMGHETITYFAYVLDWVWLVSIYATFCQRIYSTLAYKP